MATFAFGPVPEEPALLGKRRNVTSSSASRTANPAATRPGNQCLYQCASAMRGGPATFRMLLLIPRLRVRLPNAAARAERRCNDLGLVEPAPRNPIRKERRVQHRLPDRRRFAARPRLCPGLRIPRRSGLGRPRLTGVYGSAHDFEPANSI